MTLFMSVRKRIIWILVLAALTLMLGACADDAGNGQVETPLSAEIIPATNTPIPPTNTPLPTPTPTATPRPLAATVNGEPIYLEAYESELAIQEVQFSGLDPRKVALEKLIEDLLIAQEAARRGIGISPEEVDAAIAETVAKIGPEAYQLWLAENGYTEATFHDAVAAELLRTRVLEDVTADVGDSAEFVRARVIQTDSAEDAAEVVFQLQGGGDFVTLLDLYSTDPNKATTRGDIGWFTRGMLTVPELEDAAFALPTGAFSDVISVTTGITTYYVVLVTDRDPARPYTAVQQQRLINEVATAWLEETRAQAVVDVLVGLD